ncbi:hypothetical protein [uncultured Rikenella sp.]|uniref:hypothetical protein n=1 Tax=uncultured Rikenella sp. TaxID=368003 RepID=UPI00272AE186|nr:hypothetical protein [uncultured Rikenella sp.]
MENIPAIISSIAVILSAWFSYNQYAKNKLTDLKIEKWKAEEEVKSAKRSDNIAKIYGVLWQLLHELQADRVYIVQPHPLVNNLFLSVSLEVKRNGVSAMKPNVQRLPMQDVAAFSAELSARDFLLYRNIDTEVKDKRARAIMTTNGCCSVVVKRLTDDEHDWIGSIFCGFTHEQQLQPASLRQQLQEAADHIQYILPEYK